MASPPGIRGPVGTTKPKKKTKSSAPPGMRGPTKPKKTQGSGLGITVTAPNRTIKVTIHTDRKGKQHVSETPVSKPSKPSKPKKPAAPTRPSGLGLRATAPSRTTKVTVRTDRQGRQHVTEKKIKFHASPAPRTDLPSAHYDFQALQRARWKKAAAEGHKSMGMFGFTPTTLGGKVMSDLADAGIHAIPGAYAVGKAFTLDAKDLAEGHPERVHRTGDLVKAMGLSTLRTFQHPLEHPGYTLLNFGAVAGAAANAVARAGLVARAGAEGGALAAGKAAVSRMPPPGPRVIRAGGFEQHLKYSRSALARTIQRGHDAILHKLAEEGPQRTYGAPKGMRGPRVGKKGAKPVVPRATELARLNTILGKGLVRRTARGYKLMGRDLKTLGGKTLSKSQKDWIQTRAQQRLAGMAGRAANYQHLIENTLERAPAQELLHVHLDTPRQIALRLKAEGVRPEEAIAYERAQIERLARSKHRDAAVGTGKERPPFDVTGYSSKYREAFREAEGKQRRGGRLNPANLREIARHRGRIELIKMAAQHLREEGGQLHLTDAGLDVIYNKVAALSRNTDELLANMDMVTPDAAAIRKAAPGQIIRGGAVQTPEKAQRAFNEAQSALDIAQRRFDYLNERLNFRQKDAGGMVPPEGKEIQWMTEGRKKVAWIKDNKQLKEARLNKWIVRPISKDHPRAGFVVGIPGSLSEVNQLTAILRSRMSKSGNVNLLPVHDVQVGRLLGYSERRIRTYVTKQGRRHTKGAMSAARAELGPIAPSPSKIAEWQDELNQLSKGIPELRDHLAQTRKDLGGGIRGAESGLQPEIRVPLVAKGVRIPGTGRFSPGGITMFPRRPRAAGKFDPELMSRAAHEEAVTRIVAADFLEAQKYRFVINALERYKPSIADHKVRPDWIAVRIRPKISAGAKDILNEIDEGVKLTKEQEGKLKASYNEFIKDTFPSLPKPEEVMRGEVGYIDPRILGDLQHIPDAAALASGKGAALIRHWDTLNSAAKMFIIYSKIGYIPPNLLGNVALNLMQQGFMAIPNMGRAFRLSKKIGESDTNLIDVGMGRGIARGLFSDEKINPIEAIGAKTADVLSVPTDLFTRRSSFLYEAQRAGFGSRQGIQALLHDPALRRQRVEVFQRAREAAIEYENLRPWEKTYMRRLVFIYPWVKGSTMYAGRFIRDHPVQAGIYSNLGQLGMKQTQQDFPLGLPSYMQGIFKIGGGMLRPTVLDPRAAAIFETPADLAHMANALLTRKIDESSIPIAWANPLLQSIGAIAFQVNPQTREKLKPGTSLQQQVWQSFGQSAPLTQLAQGLMGQKPSEKAIVQRSPREKVVKWFGGITPYSISAENAHAKYLKEQLAGAPGDIRAQAHGKDEMRKLEQQAHDLGLLPKDKHLPKKITKEFAMRIGRDAAIAKVAKRTDSDYQIKAYTATVDFLLKNGVGTKKQRDEAIKRASTMTPEDISKMRAKLTRLYFSMPTVHAAEALNKRTEALKRLAATLHGYRVKGIGTRKDVLAKLAETKGMDANEIEDLRQHVIQYVENR